MSLLDDAIQAINLICGPQTGLRYASSATFEGPSVGKDPRYNLGRLPSLEPQIALPYLRAPNRLGARYGLRDVIAVAAATYDFTFAAG